MSHFVVLLVTANERRWTRTEGSPPSPVPMAPQARHKMDAPMRRSLRDLWSPRRGSPAARLRQKIKKLKVGFGRTDQEESTKDNTDFTEPCRSVWKNASPALLRRVPEQSKGGLARFVSVFSSDSDVKERLPARYATVNQEQKSSLLLILYTGMTLGNKNLWGKY